MSDYKKLCDQCPFGTMKRDSLYNRMTQSEAKVTELEERLELALKKEIEWQDANTELEEQIKDDCKQIMAMAEEIASLKPEWPTYKKEKK